MEVRGVMTASTKREPTAPGVGGISTREQAEEDRYRPSTLATPRPKIDDHGLVEQDQGREMPDGTAGGDDKDKHASVRGRGSGEWGEAPTRRKRNQRNEKRHYAPQAHTSATEQHGAKPVHKIDQYACRGQRTRKNAAASCPTVRLIGRARGPIWAGDRGALGRTVVAKGATVSRWTYFPEHNQQHFGQTSNQTPI